MGNAVKNLIITGKVGCGKTTLIKEATLPWRNSLAGFYTEEMREGPRRAGFKLKAFSDGGSPEGILAAKGMKSPARLNKYGVDLAVLENIGAAALEKGMAGGGKLLVIDEIGSMEILSPRFRETLLKCLQSPRPVLATIRFGSQPFTDEIKKMADTRLLPLSRENYPQVKDEVRKWIQERLESR